MVRQRDFWDAKMKLWTTALRQTAGVDDVRRVEIQAERPTTFQRTSKAWVASTWGMAVARVFHTVARAAPLAPVAAHGRRAAVEGHGRRAALG
jgi:hypothetical protein